MSNDIKDKITSFTSAFKDKEYISLKEVDLSDKTRYEISDVSDLNERSSKLTYLETLNLSHNFLTKLILNNFLSLKRIDVSSNLLIETSLTLSKLTHLDLSHNMLSSFPDISKLPKLEVLNLKHNVITKVSHLHLEPVSQTLTTLDISFNKIQFTTEEFITFIEMIRLFHLKHLNISGNDFFESQNKSNDKKDSYKKFMFATLEYVDTIDGEHNTINRNLLDKEEIKKQILLMKENVNEIERDKDDDDGERSRYTEKKEKSSVNDKSQLNITNSSINKQKRLNELNKLLEKLLQENGSNQVLYIKFLQRINELLITLLKDENDVSSKEPFSQESFTEFIMNCNNLMIINPELTNTLIKIIFQFTLFSGGSKLSSQSSDSIIEKYIHSLINTDKKKDILDAIESIIVFPDLNINILHTFIRYLKDNKTKANTILRNLILDLIYKLTSIKEEENKNKDEIDLGTTITTTVKEEDKIYKELTIVKLIQLYFKTEAFVFKRIPESERNEERKMMERKQKTATHLYNIAKGLMKESMLSLGQSQDKKNFLGISIMQHVNVDNKEKDKEKVDKKNEEQKEEQKNINQWSKTEDDTILKQQYGEMFNRWINKNEPMYFGGKSLMQSRISDFQNLVHHSLVIICNSKMNNDSNSFFKNQKMDDLYEELIKNKQFKNFKSDSKEYNTLKFTFIFISTLKECFSVLETINKIDINIVFKASTTTNNNNNKQEVQKHIDNFQRYYEYMKLFISLFKCYKYAPFFSKSKFLEVRTDTLLKELEIFIHKMYFEDTFISNHVSSAYTSWRKQFLPKIMNVYGYVLYMLDERELLNTVTQSKIMLNIYEKLKQDRVEPFMLLGCCYVIHKLLLNEHFHQKELIAQTLFEQFAIFHNLLGYVDNQNTTKFKFIEERAEREKFIAFENNGNVIMHGNYKKLLIDITKTILSIFVTMSMYGLEEYTISSSVNTMLMQLRKKGLHEVLQKNLISDIDCIRLNAIKCFFYFKHETISNDNILQIQEIIKNYSSIVKGKTELIISRIYITLNNKLTNASNKEYKPILQPMQIAVKNALEFLLKNSSRSPDDLKEVNEKNTLNLSLMLFLCTASCKPECFELVRNELGDQIHEIFNEIIYNDYYYIDENNYVPIEIERTLLGNYMIILLETLESKFCIPPYTYPFLRVLQKAADVICNFPDCTMEANYNGSIKSLIDCLTNNEMVLRKRFRVNNEIKKWNKFQGVINEKEIIMKHSYLGWYEWTEMVAFKCNTMFANNNNEGNGNSSGSGDNVKKPNEIEQLLELYINNARDKYELVEEKQKKLTEYVLDPGNERKDKNKYYRMYFNKLSVPELVMEQYRFLVLFRNVLYHIIGESSKLPSGNNIASRLKAKFDLTLMNSSEILDMYEHYEKLSQVNTAFGSVKHFDLEIPNTTPFSQVVYNKIKRNQEQLNKLKLMNNDDDDKHKNNNDNNSIANVNATENIQPQQYKLFLKDKLRIASSISSIYSLYKMNETKTFKAPDKFQNDLSRYSPNGIDETGKRIRKEETVDNPHLRSLTISAFLRCCFGLMISPSKEIRNDFIQQLFIDNKIKQILLLVDTSLHNYNNSNKICLLLEKIYNIDNLSLIIDTLKYRPAPSSQQKKNKTANEFINSFFYDSTLDNDSHSSSAEIATATTYKNTEYKHHEEKIIFHSFYVISLYMEKLIYNYYMYFYRKKEGNDFIFCYGLFAFLANYIDCVSQLHLDSINTIYYNHSIIKKFESKQLIDLILTMMKQYQQYLSFVFYFADFLQEKLSIRKGHGTYIEKQCRPIVESISKVLSYAANMQKHKYKFMKMVVTLGKHNTELMDKVIEYIHNEKKGEIINENMKEIFRLQKLMSFTMHMKQLQPNEFILFSEFVECKVFNMKDTHYSKANEGFSMDKIMNMLGVGGNSDDKHKCVSDNAFLIIRQKYIVLYEQLIDKKTKAISIEHKKPLLTVPIEDIYQIMKFDYENKLIVSIKDKTQGDKDNSFSICFCYTYLSSLFIDKVLSLKGNVIVKTHSGIQAAVANKEIDVKKAMYSKYSRTIQMRKRENELKKETDEYDFNDEIKLNNSSSSSANNNKEDDEKEMLLFTHSVNEIIKFKISTLNAIENNIYRNYTFSKANCSQFLVQWCICTVNAKDKIMNAGVVVLGDVNLYVIDEYKDFVHSLKMGMEGFDIKNKEEYYKIKEEVQLKCVKEVEECWDENEINITYCMIDDKDVLKKLCIKFSCYLEMRMFRCRLIEINKECYETEELLNKSSKETTKGGVMSLNEIPKFKCKMTINN